MAFNERQQTLTALRGMKADFDAIQTSQNKIDLLEKQVILADRDYQRESEKIEEEYRKITKRKTEQLDPEKEAAKKIPRLSREEIRKKCLPHLIAVTAMCLIWIIASFVFLNQQISPDTTKAKIAGMMTARILYVLGVVITLLMHSGDGSRSMVVGGCLVYSIPGITVFVGAILNYGTFTNVGLLSILDIALGLGAWIAALFAPSPNKAYFKEVEAAKADKAKKLEHIDEEAKNAFSDLRYEKEKTVIALRKQAAPAQEKVNALRAQLAKEKGIISAAEDRLLLLGQKGQNFLHCPCLRACADVVQRFLIERGRGGISRLDQSLAHVQLNDRVTQICQRRRGQLVDGSHVSSPAASRSACLICCAADSVISAFFFASLRARFSSFSRALRSSSLGGSGYSSSIALAILRKYTDRDATASSVTK